MKIETCPLCKAPTVYDFRPFCSARCKWIDLNKWLSGTYYIPGSREEDAEKVQENEETL